MSQSIAQDPTLSAASQSRARKITFRSVLFGLLTIVALHIYTDYAGLVLGSNSLVKSQYPMAMLLPFVIWLFGNIALKAFWPRAALTSTELIVIYSMSWIAGTIPMEGWAAYWTNTMAVPSYYASPENRWQEVLFDILPWWALTDTAPSVIQPFHNGLGPGESIPWIGWIKPIFWWTAVSLAMLAAGICVSIIFQRQWEDNERLTFPLAQFAVELTSGFDHPDRVPAIFRNAIFWAGFSVVFVVFLWNIAGYFAIDLPAITLYGGVDSKRVIVSKHFPDLIFRVMPPVVGLTYFCDLDILLSFWLLRIVAILKIGGMNLTGFSLGQEGQQAKPIEIINLESHGAMVMLAVWSIWVSREHLHRVWRAALDGPGSPANDGVISYRTALMCFVAATLFVIGWMHAIGMSIPIAILHTVIIYIAYLTVAKFTAASGFPHIFPVTYKGGAMLETFVGTANLNPRDVVGIGLVNSSAFYGNLRIPAWPSLPHHFKLLGRITRKPSRLVWMAVLAFTVGILTSFPFVISLGYNEGGQNLGTNPFAPDGGSVNVYNGMAAKILESDRTVFDPEKMTVWVLGAVEASVLILLRNHLPWWPLHPLGIAFQNTWGPELYAFSIFMTWLAKTILLHIGGIRLYRRAAPFFVGLPVGYVSGILVSGIVDIIWFPDGGHWVHGW